MKRPVKWAGVIGLLCIDVGADPGLYVVSVDVLVSRMGSEVALISEFCDIDGRRV